MGCCYDKRDCKTKCELSSLGTVSVLLHCHDDVSQWLRRVLKLYGLGYRYFQLLGRKYDKIVGQNEIYIRLEIKFSKYPRNG